MPLSPQQRTYAILGGVFGGGVLIAVLIVSLFSGGNDKNRAIDVKPNQPSTSTSTTLPTTTSFVTSSTVAPAPSPTAVTTPTTITPGTTLLVPATTTATAPTTTTTGATTTTTKPISVNKELDGLLETALLGGVPPDPDAPGRVRVSVRATSVRVAWALDESLTPDEQRVAAREETTALLRTIEEYDRLDDQPVTLRATLLNTDTGRPRRVLRLVFERATLDAIDFDAIDPLTIFELANQATVDPVLEPSPATTTTS